MAVLSLPVISAAVIAIAAVVLVVAAPFRR